MNRHKYLEEELAVYEQLDGAARGRLDAHMETCTGCRQKLAAYRLMDRRLAGLPDARPGPALRTGFYSALAKRPAFSFQASLFGRLAGVALQLSVLALVAVLALSVWWGLRDMGVPAGPAATPAITTRIPFDRIRLLGYDLHSPLRAGEEVDLSLYWRAQTPVSEAIRLVVQMVDKDEQVVTHTEDFIDLGQGSSGSSLETRHALTMPPDLRVDEYRLQVGLFEPASNRPVELVFGGQIQRGLITLASMAIQVPVHTGGPLTPTPLPDPVTIPEEGWPGTLTPVATLQVPALPPVTATPLVISSEFSFELVTQTGGALRSLAQSGQTLFAGQGPRLVALDVSNPAKPRLIGQSDLLPGLVEQVIVQEQTAYLTSGRHLVLLDVSDPATMQPTGQFELPAPGTILLHDSVVYAAGIVEARYELHDGRQERIVESYVATIDVGFAPRLLDLTMIPYHVGALALNADVLYVGAGHEPPLAIDVSDPGQIGEVLPLDLPVEAVFSLGVFGETLIIGGYYEVAAFAAGDPLRPELLWREEGPNLAQVNHFALFRDQLYTIGWQAAGAYIPARANLQLPGPLPDPVYLSSGGSVAILATADHLYTVDRSDRSLQIYERGREAEPVGWYVPLTGGPLALADGSLYVATGSNLLERYLLPDLVREASYIMDPTAELASRNIYDFTLSGDRLYVSGEYELHMLDAADLGLLGAIGSSSPLFQPRWESVSVPVVDAVAYVVPGRRADDRDELVRFDVSDPADPRRLDTTRFDRHLRVKEVAVSGQLAAVSLYSVAVDGADYLALYDLRAETPALIGEIPLVYAPASLRFYNDLLLAGSYAAGRGGFLHMFRVPDLEIVAELPLPGVFALEIAANHPVAAGGELVFVTLHQDNRLLVLDISDPGRLRAVAAFELAAAGGYLAVSGDTVVVGNDRMGLYVLRLKPMD
jgi:hypothetical protein